jgi:hypothetical protein
MSWREQHITPGEDNVAYWTDKTQDYFSVIKCFCNSHNAYVSSVLLMSSVSSLFLQQATLWSAINVHSLACLKNLVKWNGYHVT